MKKQKKKIFILCPSCAYFLLDKWLQKMSLKGWHLIDYKRTVLVFEKGQPAEHIYFTYKQGGGARRDDGHFSISLRYPLLHHTYGLSKRKSKINAKKTYQCVKKIMQIDPQKTDAGFYELVQLRNRLYMERTLRDSLLLMIALAFIIFIKKR